MKQSRKTNEANIRNDKLKDLIGQSFYRKHDSGFQELIFFTDMNKKNKLRGIHLLMEKKKRYSINFITADDVLPKEWKTASFSFFRDTYNDIVYFYDAFVLKL